MKTTVTFFKNEAEVMKYGKKNAIEGLDRRMDHLKEEWGEYFKPFAEIDGCEVGFMRDEWKDMRYCITWRGVKMTHQNSYTRGDKTQAFKLAEPLDKEGISMEEGYCNYPLQKIGKPTARKLDEWKNWLLATRERDERERDETFARMLAKIDECCEYFPEAKSVKWKDGYWTFKKFANGVEYVLQINTDGKIYERTDIWTGDYYQSPSEKAARLMQNGLAQVKPCEDSHDAYEMRSKAYNDRQEKFMGGRPY